MKQHIFLYILAFDVGYAAIVPIFKSLRKNVRMLYQELGSQTS